ncbi:MAG: tetratricopeptide repeat protein [Gemmatimonadota bacterium]|nr:tetratricopeptide repeat protein [Gemmatimonadota bacterium]
MSIESLKAQARRHEQRDEWQKALDQYGKAIEKLAEDDQPDINLYNRVGDLYVRVGNYERALEHYERAIELYREASLSNNAIAVCKKIVRHMPARHQVYLVMGQIRAEQGFVPDARTYFLTYAETMQEEGDLDESFRALVEFCDLVPEEVEVRVTVAEQMIANERPEEGLAQLSIAYRRLKEQGRDDRAFGLEGRILELDPDIDFDALLEEQPEGDEVPTEDGGFELGAGLGGFEEAVGADDGAIAEGDGIAEGAADLRDADELVDDDALAGDDEGPSLPLMDVEGPDDDVDGAEDDGWDEALVHPDESDDFELETSFADTDFEVDAEEEAQLGEEASSEEEGDVDLPLMESGGGDDDELASEADAPEPAAVDPTEASSEPPGPDEDEPGPAEPADLDSAEDEPASPEPAANDSAEPPPASHEYVDLGSMILGDEREEPKTTRFRVQYEEPSGDEAADFQKMLSQFKDKVSENLEASDVSAHYDLGTAYKEMGLLDEAIAEFQAALRASGGHLPTYEVMGQTFLEMGKSEAAAKSLERALGARTTIEDELLGIYYYLARAYEELGRTDSAVEFYDRVFALDINFADVTERLRALR